MSNFKPGLIYTGPSAEIFEIAQMFAQTRTANGNDVKSVLEMVIANQYAGKPLKPDNTSNRLKVPKSSGIRAIAVLNGSHQCAKEPFGPDRCRASVDPSLVREITALSKLLPNISFGLGYMIEEPDLIPHTEMIMEYHDRVVITQGLSSVVSDD